MKKHKLRENALGLGLASAAAFGTIATLSNNQASDPIMIDQKAQAQLPETKSFSIDETAEVKRDGPGIYLSHKLLRDGNKIILAKIIGQDKKVNLDMHNKDGRITGTDTVTVIPLTNPKGLGRAETKTFPLPIEITQQVGSPELVQTIQSEAHIEAEFIAREPGFQH